MVMPPDEYEVPGSVAIATKANGSAPSLAREILDESVVAAPEGVNLMASDSTGYVLMVAQIADSIAPWGSSPKVRDRQLRDFYPTENYAMSALASVAARNIAFNWTLKGPPRTVALAQERLLNANRGKGWESLMAQVSIDLYSQDSGAFVELIRDGGPDAPETAPVVNLAHLDAGRVYATGNPDEPYWYRDIKGIWHGLKWHQVVNLQEMPSPIEHPVAGVFYQLQYCAITRLLRAAQILRNVAIYNDEKTGGRFERAIHLVRGVTAKQISDAVAMHRNRADEAGLTRFIQTPIVGSVDPKADVGAETLELASLPAGWDEEKVMKWYIAALALAFLTDYQEFAPLPGGNLGTSAQSEVLHMKSRGKGPALYQKRIAHLMNFQGVLPQNVTFRWDETDIEADKMQADLAMVRASERSVRIMSGELDPQGARQIALDNGDMSPELFEALSQREDLTPDQLVTDLEREPERDTQDQNVIADDIQQQATKALAEAIASRLAVKGHDESGTYRTTIGAYLQTRIHRAFTDAADDIAALGAMDTSQRIRLSGIIGDTVERFADWVDETDIGRALLSDEDIEHLIDLAGKAYATKASPALKRQRVAVERAVQDPIEAILTQVHTKVRARLRGRRSVA